VRTVVLLPGRAKPLWRGHAWVFAESVAEVREEGGAGEEGDDFVRVVDAEGKVVGRGLWSERSALRVRMLTLGPDERPSAAILAERVAAAVRLRERLFASGETTAYRVVHSEGDGLPGLVVDRFGPVLSAQFATAPIHRRRRALAESLLAATGASSLAARAAGFEEEEGIPQEETAWSVGAPLPESVEVLEEGMRLLVEPASGQKTGHYCDQRANRRLVAEVAAGASLLDLYAGTGGFSIQGLRRGARAALAVESSSRAADRAREHGVLNGVAERLEVRQADVRPTLAELKASGRRFDLVVADPPNFFPRRGGDGGAIRAHRDLTVQALTRVEPGGFLATFSCSARLGTEGLVELVRSAARECRREAAILRELGAGPDHPVLPGLREGRYLTGLLLRVGGPSG
jgi:23S rRNA (cytosine1962-C5)-methyltransferase